MGAIDLKRYMLVVDMPEQDRDARRTARVAKSAEATSAARDELLKWLADREFHASEYVLEPPATFGTIGMLATERVAKALRGAPLVQAVLEA
mgnify:CR=1 FL=1